MLVVQRHDFFGQVVDQHVRRAEASAVFRADGLVIKHGALDHHLGVGVLRHVGADPVQGVADTVDHVVVDREQPFLKDLSQIAFRSLSKPHTDLKQRVGGGTLQRILVGLVRLVLIGLDATGASEPAV